MGVWIGDVWNGDCPESVGERCFSEAEICRTIHQIPQKERSLPNFNSEIWKFGLSWGAANGGLRDGGLRKSEDIWGKRPFSSVFWIFQVLFTPSGKGRKRQKKGEKGRFWPISRKGGQTPLKPPFVTPPFAAPQVWARKNAIPHLQPFHAPTRLPPKISRARESRAN